MLLQDIFKPEYAEMKEVYGITLDEQSSDTEFSSPPESLEGIGFIFEADTDGTIKENLLDIIISYNLTQLPIMVEIPSQLLLDDTLTPQYLIQLASNVGFSLSILPPGHPLVHDVSAEQYRNIITAFTKEMLNKHVFEKFVFPISSFFEYLMLEQLLGEEKTKSFVPDHDYIKNTFVDNMSVEDSDSFKNSIRELLYNYYGGKEQFELVAKTIFSKLGDRSQQMFTEFVVSNLPPEMKNNADNQNS